MNNLYETVYKNVTEDNLKTSIFRLSIAGHESTNKLIIECFESTKKLLLYIKNNIHVFKLYSDREKDPCGVGDFILFNVGNLASVQTIQYSKGACDSIHSRVSHILKIIDSCHCLNKYETLIGIADSSYMVYISNINIIYELALRTYKDGVAKISKEYILAKSIEVVHE